MNLSLTKILLSDDFSPLIYDLTKAKVNDKLTPSDFKTTIKGKQQNYYLAPEIFNSSPSTFLDGAKVDSFALGVMLFMAIF
jgi:hypothetical protein